jgi:flagellin
MAVRIFNNLASINAQRHLGINNQRLAQSIERVSSGLRINSASDDAAGLAISEKMRSDIRVLQQGLRNLNDGLSLVNVAEASLNEVSDMIIRMRELAAQAASGTIGDTERTLLQVEVTQMIAEIDRVSAAAEFNGQLLFFGALDPASLTPVIISFGLDATANSQLDLNATLNLANAGVVNSTFFGVNAINISTALGAQTALTTLDTAGTGIDLVVSTRATFAAVQNRMTRIVSTQAITVENLQAAESQIRDADIAEEIALLTRNQILVESATAMVGQANLIPQSVLQLLG